MGRGMGEVTGGSEGFRKLKEVLVSRRSSLDACDWSPEDNGCREVEGSRGSDQAIVRAPGLFYFCSSWADPLCGPSPGVFWKFLEVIYFGESLNSAPGPGSSVRVPGCGLAARGLSDLGCGAQGVVSESPDETVVSGAARVAMFEWTATSQLAPSSGHTASVSRHRRPA